MRDDGRVPDGIAFSLLTHMTGQRGGGASQHRLCALAAGPGQTHGGGRQRADGGCAQCHRTVYFHMFKMREYTYSPQ